MPRFSQSDDAFLKRAMLPRAPGCVFTPEDVDFIAKETELDKETILHWAANLRWRASTNALPGRMSVEEYLKASPESPEGKVIFFT